jgi:hypothetical protein
MLVAKDFDFNKQLAPFFPISEPANSRKHASAGDGADCNNALTRTTSKPETIPGTIPSST